MIVEQAESTVEVDRIRDRLDRIDADLVEMIARRAELGRALGHAKRSAGLPMIDFSREAAVVRRAAVLARHRGLPEEDVREIFWDLISVTRRVQLEEP
jgi:chorismate mutase